MIMRTADDKDARIQLLEQGVRMALGRLEHFPKVHLRKLLLSLVADAGPAPEWATRQSSATLSSLAARVLSGYQPTLPEIRSLAASVLSQDETKGQ